MIKSEHKNNLIIKLFFEYEKNTEKGRSIFHRNTI